MIIIILIVPFLWNADNSIINIFIERQMLHVLVSKPIFLLSRNFPALRDVSKIHLRAGLPPSELFLCSQVINTDKRMAREQNLNRRYGRTATEDSSNDTSALKPYILVAIAAIACYLNSLFGEFVYDDFEVIETNADVR